MWGPQATLPLRIAFRERPLAPAAWVSALVIAVKVLPIVIFILRIIKLIAPGRVGATCL